MITDHLPLVRIWKIFDNSKLRQRRILTSHLLIISGVAIGINLLLLIIWTAVDPLQAIPSGNPRGRCQGNKTVFQEVFKAIFAVYNSILVVLGAYLCFLTRNVNSSFNESKFIGYTVCL